MVPLINFNIFQIQIIFFKNRFRTPRVEFNFFFEKSIILGHQIKRKKNRAQEIVLPISKEKFDIEQQGLLLYLRTYNSLSFRARLMKVEGRNRELWSPPLEPFTHDQQTAKCHSDSLLPLKKKKKKHTKIKQKLPVRGLASCSFTNNTNKKKPALNLEGYFFKIKGVSLHGSRQRCSWFARSPRTGVSPRRAGLSSQV